MTPCPPCLPPASPCAPQPADSWRPDSFYDRIASNRRAGLHTLCLLDIKVKEPSLESLARGKKVGSNWAWEWWPGAAGWS